MVDDLLVNRVLEQIRPTMQRDGGNVELVKIEGAVVYIRLLGACTRCPISFITVTYGIQETLQKEIPAVERVVVVKD